MNKLVRFKTRAVSALVVATLAGCGAAEPGEGSVGAQAEARPVASAPAAKASAAEQIIAANGKADVELHLLARKVLNGSTEVAEFYEPVAGQILFSAAGSPTAKTVIRREQIQGKTASEVWAVIAPGEPMPRELADAVARSSSTVAENSATAEAKQPEITSSAATSEVAVKPELIVPMTSGGYCATQFWTDWGNWGGANSTVSQTYNYGWNNYGWSNVTGTAGYIVCPQGNVSNTGGQLTVNFPNGTTSVWAVQPNYYRWTTSTAGENCGWDISCWAAGMGDRCSPIAFGINGRYDSSCYLTKGTSCGDNYDWITWASSAGSYCETPHFN